MTRRWVAGLAAALALAMPGAARAQGTGSEGTAAAMTNQALYGEVMRCYGFYSGFLAGLTYLHADLAPGGRAEGAPEYIEHLRTVVPEMTEAAREIVSLVSWGAAQMTHDRYGIDTDAGGLDFDAGLESVPVDPGSADVGLRYLRLIDQFRIEHEKCPPILDQVDRLLTLDTPGRRE